MDTAKFKSIYQKFKNFSSSMKESHVGEHSAQCAYYTILSFIPFVILLMSLIKYTGIEAQTLYDVISKIVPENMEEFIVGIVQEVYSKSIGTISVSILFTLWSAGKGLFELTKSLQEIYHTDDIKNVSYIYLRIKALICTVLFIILIVFGLFIMVFGNTFVAIIQEHFGGFENYTTISSLLTKLAITIVITFIFMLLYKFMPKHKVTLRSQFYGAILAAIALNIISLLFSKYLDIFKGFSITYGSLTTLMLIMMWVYSFFYTIFSGAKLNKFMEQKKIYK